MELTEKTVSCIKVLFIGDIGVGKSSIIRELNNSSFEENINDNKSLIECKRITCRYNKKELCLYSLKVHINENKDFINDNILLDVNLIFLIFDLNNKESFLKICKIYEIFYKDIPIYLIGNKCDLERKIDLYELKNFIYEKNFEYFEISTLEKNNFNVIYEKIFTVEYKYFTEIRHYDKKRALFSNNSYKIILLGDSTVGKSSFFTRYFDDSFDENMLSTVGTCNKSEILKIDNDIINVQIWDTAGQERFKSLMRTYYVNADGIILFYDITNMSSFKNVTNWIKDISNNTNKKKIVIYLIGNKIDLLDKRVVNYEDAIDISNELKINLFEISVKFNLNVREIIRRMVKEIYKIANKNLNSSKLTDIEKKSKVCCL